MTQKVEDEPHVRSNLKYCRPCTAHSKRTGLLCKQPAMKNGKCRFHGGKSTGPKTLEGLERSRKANYKHGLYTQGHLIVRAKIQGLLRVLRNIEKDVDKILS